jgi:hypothetical protein
MNATAAPALVQKVHNPYFRDTERRDGKRFPCDLEATSHAVDPGRIMSWGAVVNDISSGGVSVTLCYPFRPGTYLAVDLSCASGIVRTLMVRVIHVHDQRDGMWRLGCEFLKPLTLSELELIV